MVMSRYQNTGRSHSIKTDNSAFERVEEFKYFGTTLTNQNFIQEEIKKLCVSWVWKSVFSSLILFSNGGVNPS